jgi:ATP-dependent RNA helicase DeaD
MGLINEFTGLKDIEIGKIELLRNFSFFEVDSDFASAVLKAFDNKEYKSRKIVLEVAESKGRLGGGKRMDESGGRVKKFDRENRRGGERYKDYKDEDREREKNRVLGRERHEYRGNRDRNKSLEDKSERKGKSERNKNKFEDVKSFGMHKKRRK